MPPSRKKAKAVSKTLRKRVSKKVEYLEFRHLDRAAEVAFYYGFTPIAVPFSIGKEERELARSLTEANSREKADDSQFGMFIEEKIAVLRYCLEKGISDGPLPVLLYGEGVFSASAEKKGAEKMRRIFLDIIGSGKSVAEALLIKTVWTALLEEGRDNMTLALNSVGDKESLLKFTRELAAYYRKNINSLTSSCRADLRRDPLLMLSCENEKCRSLREAAPKPMAFLSETSRAHFREVLEYVESLGIPYRIDHCLVGGKPFAGEIFFEIRAAEPTKDKDGGEIICFGSRYNGVAKKIGFRKDTPAVGATFFVSRSMKEGKRGRTIRIKKPRIFFLQLGFAAKLKSFKVIETLRKAKIPLCQALTRDKLATQLASAENLKTPYSLIMGQKEAIEDSVIVRDNATRSQETVRIDELPVYLKGLKLT